MSEVRKKINIKEFREKGYLQEINRTFLHPLGLALEVEVDSKGFEKISGIWDSRGNPENACYGLEDSEMDRRERFLKNVNFIEKTKKEVAEKRKKALGFVVEPIPLEKK